MNYDKGPQITVGKLKQYLAIVPDDVKIWVGLGSEVAQAHYLLNHGGDLMLHPDAYMIDAEEQNIKTVLSFNTKKP